MKLSALHEALRQTSMRTMVSNLPASIDPEESEVVVKYQLMAGEPRTPSYPGSAPHVELTVLKDGVDITDKLPEEVLRQFEREAFEAHERGIGDPYDTDQRV